MTPFRSNIPITPEEAARHDGPAQDDDDAPPMTRLALLGWMTLGAVWAAILGGVVVLIVGGGR